MMPRSRATRAGTRLVAGFVPVMAAVVVAAVALAPSAGAHGVQGTLGIEVAPGAAPLTAAVRVLLEYANDRDVAPGATVVAEAAGPGGQTVAARPLADQGKGVYAGTLTMPAAGSWTVTVTATDPVATAQAVVVVSAVPSPPTAGTGGSTTTTGDVRTSGDRVDRAAEPSDGGGGGSDDGGSGGALLVVIGVVLVAAGVGAVFVVRRRPRD